MQTVILVWVTLRTNWDNEVRTYVPMGSKKNHEFMIQWQNNDIRFSKAHNS